MNPTFAINSHKNSNGHSKKPRHTEQRLVRNSDVLRDFFVALLPVRILPERWIRKFYGFNPDFIFLTHPRSLDDIYQSWPAGKILRKYLSERVLLKFLTFCPCYVIGSVLSPTGLRGLMITTTYVPTSLLSSQTQTMKLLGRIFRFIKKISTKQHVYIGLGGWWPIVTNGGVECQRFLSQRDNIIVTNGHCATLLSLYLTVAKISKLGGVPLKQLSVLIIGVGRIGMGLARLINGKVGKLGLLDRDSNRTNSVESELLSHPAASTIAGHAISSDPEATIYSLVGEYDVIVSTTSNIGHLVRKPYMLRDCVVVDDARPESFPRLIDYKRKAIVLEGGLIKVQGVETTYDFGFGCADNIFGCLADAYFLALDGGRSLTPTIGDVSMQNFQKMLEFCSKYDIAEGDLKCGQYPVPSELVREILSEKKAKSVSQKLSTTPKPVINN